MVEYTAIGWADFSRSIASLEDVLTVCFKSEMTFESLPEYIFPSLFFTPHSGCGGMDMQSCRREKSAGRSSSFHKVDDSLLLPSYPVAIGPFFILFYEIELIK